MNIKKLLGFFTTPVFLLLFFSTLLLFHPLLVIAYRLFGYTAHKFVLEWMNRFIVFDLRMAGTRFSFIIPFQLPEGRPAIIVANHQSMYDIPLILLKFRKYHPKFIAKKELARGLPSISFALRNMGSAIIDRADAKQALSEIERFAIEVNRVKHTACLFPEGTRARDGKIKKFKSAGMSTLIQNMPDALIVPVVIAGNWEILKYKFKPVPFGVKVTLKMLEPFEINGRSGKEICEISENLIARELAALQG